MPASTSTSTDVGGVSAQAPPAPISQPLYHDPVVENAIEQFIANAPHWEVIVSGRELLLYDTDIFAPHGAVGLESVTYTFDDGTSLSLVGTTADLAFTHGLH